MRWRQLVAGALAALGAMGAVAASAGAAHADSPVQSAWWDEARQNASVPQSDTTDQLVLRNTPSGAAAFGALRYITDGATGGSLTLKITDSKSIQPPELIACVTASSWSAGADQSWDTAPSYRCSAGEVSGAVSSDGTTATFQLGPALQTQPGTFDFVVLPDPGDQQPFQVTLAADASSFTPTGGGSGAVGSGPPPSTGTAPGAAPAPAPAAQPAPAPAAGPATTMTVAGPAAPAPAVAAPAATPAQSAPAVAAPLQRPVASSARVGSDGGRKLGIGIIVALALGLMVIMAAPGSPVAQRRLLAPALAPAGAAESVPPVGDGAARPGGVGRFVRPRDKPPVRL